MRGLPSASDIAPKELVAPAERDGEVVPGRPRQDSRFRREPEFEK
jgi:hypothetical protein